MKHLRRKNRRSRFTVSESDILFGGLLFMLALLHSVVFNGFAWPVQDVQGLCRVISQLCTRYFPLLSYTYTYLCRMCRMCRLFQVSYSVFLKTRFFSKKNFNSKLPCTACTDCSSPVVSRLWAVSNPAQHPAQTLHKGVCSLHKHQILTANHGSLTINRIDG